MLVIVPVPRCSVPCFSMAARGMFAIVSLFGVKNGCENHTQGLVEND